MHIGHGLSWPDVIAQGGFSGEYRVSEQASLPLRVSVIVPTWNEAAEIDSALQAVLDRPEATEVIVVDGDSSDGTVERIRRYPVRLFITEPARGKQLRMGAKNAHEPVLLFVHADTRLPADAMEQIAAAISDPRVIGGCFRLRFARTLLWVPLLDLVYGLLACVGVYFGRAGYFVLRNVYEAAGGFRPYPVFEDLDLRRRLRDQGRFICLRGIARTSPRRFQGWRFPMACLRSLWMQGLYCIGMSTEFIGSFYRPVRLTPGFRGQAPAGRDSVPSPPPPDTPAAPAR